MRFLNWRRYASMVLALAGLLSGASTAWAADIAGKPVFAFTTRDRGAMAVVDKYFRKGDYVNINAAEPFPELRKRIGKDNLFRLSPSIAEMQRWTSMACGDPDSPGLIIYDIEKWEATSAQERADVPGSLARAANLVKATGCRSYGIAPARAYLSGSEDQCSAVPGALPRRGIEWRDVRVLVIQAQGLLRDKCLGVGGIENYRSYVAELARIARARNPDVVVLAEVSFNRSRPEVMVEAINRTKDVADGFYLAYPTSMKCEYCNPAALEWVLSRFRTPVTR